MNMLRRIFKSARHDTTRAPVLPEPPAQRPLESVTVPERLIVLPKAPPTENKGIDFMLQRLDFLTQDVHPLV